MQLFPRDNTLYVIFYTLLIQTACFSIMFSAYHYYDSAIKLHFSAVSKFLILLILSVNKI